MSGEERTTGIATPAGERPMPLRMAHIHLRTGAFALARAELESLAGSGGLDDSGLLDLAEIRWRTGDLAGAGEAANAYLAGRGDESLGLVIAAEAGAALGLPAEARRLVEEVLEREAQLDALFAGMPRSALWPRAPEGLDVAEPAGLLFPSQSGGEAGPSPVGAAGPPSRPDVPSPVLARWPAAPGPALPSPDEAEPGLWDAEPALSAGPLVPDGPAEVEAGRAAMARGAHPDAALHLAVALRLAPTTAPAVLQIIGDAPGSALALVRGDALRILGQEWDARRIYASVAARVHERTAAAATGPAGAALGTESTGDPGSAPTTSSVPFPDPGVPPPKEEA